MSPSEPRTLSALLHQAARRLWQSGCADSLDEGRLEAELLYAQAAGSDRAHVLAAGGKTPAPAVLARFEELLARRMRREPLAYIRGEREFYGLTFLVGPGVLIPRPETETLVEAALAAIRDHPRARRRVRVADVGTGSGAIALSIARHAPTAEVFAVDESSEALVYAGRNRERLGVIDRVVLLTGDLLEPIDEPLDVVIANLPYIPTEEFEALPPEIRTQEPRLAVDGGEDGLELVRRLLAQLPEHLAADACAVLLEVGAGQADYVATLLEEALRDRWPAVTLSTHLDLLGIKRVVEARCGY